MTNSSAPSAPNAGEHLQRLLSYLEADPLNESLRADVADSALAAGDFELARLLFRGRDPGTLDDRQLGLLGLAQMQAGSFAEAVESHRALVERGVDDPAVRFNLAWSLAMQKDFAAALEMLSPDVTSDIPQAAMLHVQLLHELGEFDAAEAAAREHIERFPDHSGLAAAVSVLALDVEDRELASRCAGIAGNHPDALATLGTLALADQRVAEAETLFGQVIELNPSSPRAWIGRGLARLVDRTGDAAADIDRGAELFGDHLGSWVAAGWAHLVAGDRSTARQRFEQALAIDPSFGEAQGSLAVIDLLDGREADARRRVETARRLDRDSFSAGFATMLLMERGGDTQGAQALLERLLNTPINERGDTAVAALMKLGIRR